MQPGDTLTSCHAVRLRPVITPDHLSYHRRPGSPCTASARSRHLLVLRRQVRTDEGREREKKRKARAIAMEVGDEASGC